MSAANKKTTGAGAGQGASGNGGAGAPDGFEFSSENTAEISRILERYPADHCESAVMPILDLAQRQMGGWLSLLIWFKNSIRTVIRSIATIRGAASIGQFSTLFQICLNAVR